MTWGAPVNASRRRGFALLISLALGCVSADEPTTSTDAGGATPDAGSDRCDGFDFTEMPALAEMMGVYDERRQRIVFFGGDDVLPVNCSSAPHAVGRFELYTYDTACGAFREETGSSGPRGRARGMAVYDPQGDRMILFGGRSRARETGDYKNYNDVWALNLETMEWTELVPSNRGPMARSNPAGGFNRATRELIVFGGNTSRNGLAFSPRNDVWALDTVNLTWRQIEADGTKPTARLFHAAAVDDTNNRLFVYGGGDAGAWQGPFLGDLWMMDLESGAWERLASFSAEDGPAARIWSSIIYDVASDRVVLFGGHDDGEVGNNNDTWSFELSERSWSAVVAPETVSEPALGFCNFPPNFTEPNLEAPDRRSAHLAALDKQRGEWFIFAGKTDCGIINDIWVYDLARDAWLKRQPSTVGEACVRSENPDRCVALCQ